MQRKPLLQPEFNAGEEFPVLMASDEAFINGMYDGLSYQSRLSLSLDHNYYYGEVKPLLFSSFHSPLVNDTTYAFASTQTPATYDFSTENPDAQKLKFPKLEPVTDNVQLYPYNNEIYLNEPSNYFSNNSDGFGYHRLPDLRCLEQPNYFDFHYGDSSSLVTTENRVEPVTVNLPKPKNRQPYASSATRLRRQKLSEKTRCLEKLLPWDTKMDTGTMLEEAYKYVKFLQAQVSVLQSMPPAASEDRNGKTLSSVNSLFGRLNRQQLLQVVLNSPVAQTYLYSKGCCVYSVEQLVQYKKMAQRNALYRQTLLYSGMLS